MKNSIILVVLLVLVGIFGISTFYFYRQYSGLKADPQKAAQEVVKDLLVEVSQLMVLPLNETPTVATVVDSAKLKDQPFFVNATTGDKVLIYSNARKAILYNPTTKKIVEVAPLTIGNNSQQVSNETNGSNSNISDVQ